MADQTPNNPMDDEPEEGFRELVVAWAPAILAVIFIRLFVFEPFRIPSGSMVPTLLIGDHVFVTKFAYGVWMPFKSMGVPMTDMGLDWTNIELLDLSDPDRGDVIVFHYPQNEDMTYIKRVIGVPGDTVSVIDNQPFINGVPLNRVELDPNYTDVDGNCTTRSARRWAETIPRQDGTTMVHSILTNSGRAGFLADHPKLTVPPETVFVMGDNRDHSQDSRAWGFVRYDQIKGKAHFTWMSWDGCENFAGSLRLDRMFRSLYTEEGLSPDAG